MSGLPSWLESILPNLFSILVAGMVTLVVSYFIQRWTQNRAWRVGYILRNVQRTYIPLYGEITKAIRDVNKCQPPQSPPEAWNKITSAGLTEVMRIDDSRLYEKLEHFYETVYPRLHRELTAARNLAHNDILKVWEKALLGHLTSMQGGIDYQSQARSYSADVWAAGVGDCLLRNDLDSANVMWNRNKDNLLNRTDAKLFSVSESWFNPIELAKQNLQNLELKQKELVSLLNEEKTDEIVRQLQGHIGRPWSRNYSWLGRHLHPID